MAKSNELKLNLLLLLSFYPSFIISKMELCFAFVLEMALNLLLLGVLVTTTFLPVTVAIMVVGESVTEANGNAEFFLGWSGRKLARLIGSVVNRECQPSARPRSHCQSVLSTVPRACPFRRHWLLPQPFPSFCIFELVLLRSQ